LKSKSDPRDYSPLGILYETDHHRHSEKDELDLQLRAVPDIEKRIAELSAE